RHPDMPEVRALPEFGRTEEDRQVFRLLGSISDIGRPIATGPRVPPERGEALRQAIAAMLKDPAFIADTDQLGLGINYLPGRDLQKLVTELMASPASVIEKAKAVTAPPK